MQSTPGFRHTRDRVLSRLPTFPDMLVRGVMVSYPRSFRGTGPGIKGAHDVCEESGDRMLEGTENCMSGDRGREKNHVESHRADPGTSPTDVLPGFHEG